MSLEEVFEPSGVGDADRSDGGTFREGVDFEAGRRQDWSPSSGHPLCGDQNLGADFRYDELRGIYEITADRLQGSYMLLMKRP